MQNKYKSDLCRSGIANLINAHLRQKIAGIQHKFLMNWISENKSEAKI